MNVHIITLLTFIIMPVYTLSRCAHFGSWIDHRVQIFQNICCTLALLDRPSLVLAQGFDVVYMNHRIRYRMLDNDASFQSLQSRAHRSNIPISK